MSSKGGRPRTFPPGAVEAALERQARTGESWGELGRALGVHPGTLKARAAEARRSSAYKTPPEAGSALEVGPESSPPARCPECRAIHSPGVPCP